MTEPTPTPAIQAVKLSIGHEKRPVVLDLNFTLMAGSTLALVGGNGSGKTTLLRTIAGLLPPPIRGGPNSRDNSSGGHPAPGLAGTVSDNQPFAAFAGP